MKKFNRYIFTVKCKNQNGESFYILVNSFISENFFTYDDYISVSQIQYIDCISREYLETNYKVIYEDIREYEFQKSYKSNIDEDIVINNITRCCIGNEDFIHLYKNSDSYNKHIYQKKVDEWNDEIYDNFELVYKEK